MLIGDGTRKESRREANARLIAAAPAMYEVLQATSKESMELAKNLRIVEHADKLREVLAKVEGGEG